MLGKPTQAEIERFRCMEKQLTVNPSAKLSPADVSLLRRLLKFAREEYEFEIGTDIRIDCEQ